MKLKKTYMYEEQARISFIILVLLELEVNEDKFDLYKIQNKKKLFYDTILKICYELYFVKIPDR